MMHESDGALATRVRLCLARLFPERFEHLRITEYGPHVFIAGAPSAARLSHIEGDLFGLAFRDGAGRWGTMFVIDTLEEIVADLAPALDVAPPSSRRVRAA
jgi:hypothetical protein